MVPEGREGGKLESTSPPLRNGGTTPLPRSYSHLSYYYKYYGPIKTLKFMIYSFYQKLRLSRLNLKVERVMEVNGYRLSTMPGDRGISSELAIWKTHEPLTTNLLKQELKRGMTCLDIGSNIGYYALLEQKIVGKEGRVITIEPSPLTFSYLKKNLIQNGFGDLESYNFALSSYDGRARLLMAEKSNLSKIVNASESPPGGVVIDVPTMTLDSFAAQHNLNRLDFLRMDVEGHEGEIFRGGLQTIERYGPILLMEVHEGLLGLDQTCDFLRSLQDIGYAIKYYIPRHLDIPLIGSARDVREIRIDELVTKLMAGLIPDSFQIFLVNTKKRLD